MSIQSAPRIHLPTKKRIAISVEKLSADASTIVKLLQISSMAGICTGPVSYRVF